VVRIDSERKIYGVERGNLLGLILVWVSSSSVLNRLLNQSEEITYSRLTSICEPIGAHVYPKVRLADVFPIANSGITDEEFRFCLQSHFDFIVTNEQHEPLFAVEFDGDSHA
jgi:Protein of unknown function (DUF2726)